MTSIIDFALSKAKTTMMIALMVVIAGSYARQEIPIAASPNVQLPFISVSVFLDGASPGDTSRLIARPLENRLKTITGVKNIRSTSSLSFARIFLEFEVGFDMDQALVDIKQGVEETKYELPREAEDPQISEYSEASFPVMNISIVGSSSIRQKVYYAKELKDKVPDPYPGPPRVCTSFRPHQSQFRSSPPPPDSPPLLPRRPHRPRELVLPKSGDVRRLEGPLAVRRVEPPVERDVCLLALELLAPLLLRRRRRRLVHSLGANRSRDRSARRGRHRHGARPRTASAPPSAGRAC